MTMSRKKVIELDKTFRLVAEKTYIFIMIDMQKVTKKEVISNLGKILSQKKGDGIFQVSKFWD